MQNNKDIYSVLFLITFLILSYLQFSSIHNKLISDISGKTSNYFTMYHSNVLKSNKSIVTDKWLRFRTGNFMRVCSKNYERLACTRIIEGYTCYKYKFNIHGSLNIPCNSNKNTTIVFNSRGWYGINNRPCDQYIRGYLVDQTTEEQYLIGNVTQERLNEIFKFKETLDNMCNVFYNMNVCCGEKCTILVWPDEFSGSLPNYNEICSKLYDKLLERNITYNPIYEKVDNYYLQAIKYTSYHDGLFSFNDNSSYFYMVIIEAPIL